MIATSGGASSGGTASYRISTTGGTEYVTASVTETFTLYALPDIAALLDAIMCLPRHCWTGRGQSARGHTQKQPTSPERHEVLALVSRAITDL